MITKRLVAGLRIRQGRLSGTNERVTLGQAARTALAAGADEISLIDESYSLGEVGELLRATAELRRAIGPAPLAVGGGVGSLEDVTRLLTEGASRVMLATMAVVNPELVRQVAERFGPQAVSTLIEVRLERRRGEATADVSAESAMLAATESTGGWYRVYVRGGNTATSRDAIAWAQECAELGTGEIIVSGIEPTGEAARYDLELIGRMNEAVDVPVLAAGPPRPLDQIRKALTLSGASGVMVLNAAAHPASELRRLRDELERTGLLMRTPTASQ